MTKEPYTLKNNDVVEFVTEMDQIFVDSMPDTRKFVRLALPGEVDGQLPVMAMRIIFQNDQGALFKGLIFPPKGKYTVADLNQLMLINDCGLEGLFYKSYKIKMEKEVKYECWQQKEQIYRGIIDTVAYKNEKQIPGHIWHCIEDSGLLETACNLLKAKTGHTVMFFESKRVDLKARRYMNMGKNSSELQTNMKISARINNI